MTGFMCEGIPLIADSKIEGVACHTKSSLTSIGKIVTQKKKHAASSCLFITFITYIKHAFFNKFLTT